MPTLQDPEPNTAQYGADLWMVLAVIQPFRLDAVTLALESIPGLGGMTVSECRGFGHGKVTAEPPDKEGGDGRRAAAGVVDFTAKLRLDIAVAGRARAAEVIETIARAAHTGRRGDGKIFLWPLAHVVRVRTMQVDGEAL